MTVFLYPFSPSVDVLLFLLFQQVSPTDTYVMDGWTYVNLIIPGAMKTLALCEVEVYGEGVTMSHILVNKT